MLARCRRRVLLLLLLLVETTHDDHYIALTESGANYFSNDPMKTWP